MREERLLERLRSIEKSPQRRTASNPNRLVDSIMRHLSRILNTRQESAPTVPDLGVPDFTNLPGDSDTESVQEIERAIRRVIRKYEPRLVQPRIEYIARDDLAVSLRFKISAVLAGDRTPVVFNTAVSDSGRVVVSDYLSKAGSNIMFNRYYQDELAYLRDMAKEFAGLHLALAPMLSGPTSDPDVERLLEGVAFSTAMLRQKLDDEFPEIIHGLMDIIFPHYLRPIPSTSIVAFFPKAGLNEPVEVPQGTGLESVPVDGTACGFKTCYDVTVEPLALTHAGLVEEPGRPVHIRLSMEVTDGDLSSWRGNRVRFLLGAGVADATNLYLLLSRHLARVVLRPRQGGREHVLPPESLKHAGFADNEQLIPYPRRAFSGYRLLQEYFIQQRKFLYMDLEDLDRWQDRGTGNRFEIVFEFGETPFQPPRVRRDDFVLFATPVINIFPHSAEPVDLDHRQAAVPVRPSGGKPGHYQVYSVDKVVGVIHGSAKKKRYLPLERFEHGEGEHPVYQVVRRTALNENSLEFSLTFPYTESAGTPARETLSLALSCTNGSLAESLQLGDISRPTYSTPIGVTFRNIIPPTMPIAPDIGKDTLWRFLSHLSLNLLSIASTESLKELLHLYIYPEGRDRAKIAANEKRISGIQSVESRSTQRVIGGHLMRGWQVHLEMRQDRFAGPGDMYLFCNVLDAFFGMCAGLNSFTRLSVRDTMTGEEYQWPPRIGERHLL